jgi:hypothetical protein
MAAGTVAVTWLTCSLRMVGGLCFDGVDTERHVWQVPAIWCCESRQALPALWTMLVTMQARPVDGCNRGNLCKDMCNTSSGVYYMLAALLNGFCWWPTHCGFDAVTLRSRSIKELEQSVCLNQLLSRTGASLSCCATHCFVHMIFACSQLLCYSTFSPVSVAGPEPWSSTPGWLSDPCAT